MPPKPTSETTDYPPQLQREVRRKEQRKLRARREGSRGVWFGLGMFGLVGWSIAVPTVIGVMLGIFIDSRYTSRASWTLMLLFAGIVIGCLNAWHWVKRESEPLTRNKNLEEENREESR